jgi:hypothetical protein
VLEQETTVAPPRWARPATWLGVPLIAGGLLPLVVRLGLRVPLPGPWALVRDLPTPAVTISAAVLGAALGLVLAAFADREALTVRIGAAEVVLSRPGTVRAVPRADVAVAFGDRDHLVLLGRTGRELAREPSYLGARRLEAAFTAHGVAWSAGDPYRDAYRRWVPGLPELPATAHALLTARQTAIDNGDEKDQRELRDELGRLGYVIRDDHKRQYWRRAG